MTTNSTARKQTRAGDRRGVSSAVADRNRVRTTRSLGAKAKSPVWLSRAPALLAFALALIAFNALGVVQAALRKKHGAEKIQNELSKFYLGESMHRAEAALEVSIDAGDWTTRYATLPPAALAEELVRLAGHVDLRKLKKHRRGPKKPAPRRTFDPAHPHASTARILAKNKKKSPRHRQPAKSKR